MTQVHQGYGMKFWNTEFLCSEQRTSTVLFGRFIIVQIVREQSQITQNDANTQLTANLIKDVQRLLVTSLGIIIFAQTMKDFAQIVERTAFPLPITNWGTQ